MKIKWNRTQGFKAPGVKNKVRKVIPPLESLTPDPLNPF